MSLRRTDNLAPGRIVVPLSGELDMASTWAWSALDETVRSHPHTQIVVDLSDVTFLAAHALSAFARAHNRAAATGGSVSLHGASSHARRLLRICHLEHMLSQGDPLDPEDPAA